MICCFSSELVNLGCFQLTSTESTTVLLVELTVIEHGCQALSHARTGNLPQLEGDVFLISGAAQKAVLCIQHYLRLPKLLVLKMY